MYFLKLTFVDNEDPTQLDYLVIVKTRFSFYEGPSIHPTIQCYFVAKTSVLASELWEVSKNGITRRQLS